MEARVNDKLVEAAGEKMVQYYFDGKEWRQKWEKKFEACEVVMSKHSHEIEEIRKKVLDGFLSPLAYHAEINLFDVKLLASYTGIPKKHVKKHFTPEYFNRLDEESLKKYATVLEITVEELKEVAL